jgi:hypothetical protein
LVALGQKNNNLNFKDIDIKTIKYMTKVHPRKERFTNVSRNIEVYYDFSYNTIPERNFNFKILLWQF